MDPKDILPSPLLYFFSSAPLSPLSCFPLAQFLLIPVVVGDKPLAYPVGQRLAVVGEDDALLVEAILDIPQFDEDRGRRRLPQHIQSAAPHRAGEPAARLVPVVLMGERRLQGFRQMAAFAVFFGMIKKDIRPVAFAPAVHVHEDRPFVHLPVAAEEPVDLVATLLEAAYLVERNRLAHAGFAFAVRKIAVVADAVFRVLDDDMHLRAPHQQLARQPKDDVVRILVFVQLHLPDAADRPRIRASVSAHEVEAGPFQLGGNHVVGRQAFAEQRLVVFPPGRRVFQRRKGVFHPHFQAVSLAELPAVEGDELLLHLRPAPLETSEEKRDAFPLFRKRFFLGVQGEAASRKGAKGKYKGVENLSYVHKPMC